ncbi:glycerol-3-phosphate 1-O-acyltransferase PlsY [Natranaerobius trueperi]|uniref:Glycerol-3-phosphate acyltransferase n=1 Tax=Natranaerobius trueperi TaxID=759412 RepID=A0A226BVZ5_9FIRM|nr:glycerol-3-phosphate 1-O-acyltransferase PlsY [Natranaerobius trueperi]OWZ82952.1 acyl-phosphate glycerol 3-phosphate acyltransferase [Natranaerobius trueperi]
MLSFFLMIFAYLLGSIPGGYIIGKYIHGIDIREYGSKNAGATNVLRTLGKKEGFLTLIFDGFKGYIVIKIALLLGLDDLFVILSGLAVIIGHNWPIFFQFKGGRGIATSIGILIGLSWQVFVTVVVIGLIPVVITKYVSLGSITGAVVLPWVMLLFGNPFWYLVFALAMSIMAIIRHISNIKRLIQGTERKLGEKYEISKSGREK